MEESTQTHSFSFSSWCRLFPVRETVALFSEQKNSFCGHPDSAARRRFVCNTLTRLSKPDSINKVFRLISSSPFIFLSLKILLPLYSQIASARTNIIESASSPGFRDTLINKKEKMYAQISKFSYALKSFLYASTACFMIASTGFTSFCYLKFGYLRSSRPNVNIFQNPIKIRSKYN